MTRILLSAAAALLLTTGSCGNANLTNALIGTATQAVSAMTVSDSDIQNYVSQYVASSDQQNQLAPASNPYSQRLARITAGLTQVDGIPLNFKVYLTNDVNAFACADGSVRVYSGLMDLMTDDEVLGVIGHEIGHVAHKDSKHAFQQAIINSAVLDGVGTAAGSSAQLSQTQLGQIGAALVNSKFSRSQESNADDYGYDFLKANGKNPWSMALALQKLMSLESGTQAAALTQLFSSHPATSDRINHIVERCQKDGIAAPAN